MASIALDFDETYTEDPTAFNEIVRIFKARGHTVTFVTFRDPRYNNTDIEVAANELGIDIVFTSGKQKAHVFKADIWIDDTPVLIPSAVDLGNTYDGCLIIDDMV